jgi:hypothetical protein
LLITGEVLEGENGEHGAIADAGVFRDTPAQEPDGDHYGNEEKRRGGGPENRPMGTGCGNGFPRNQLLKAGFIDLGSLKGNIGDQNYKLGGDLDLNKYRAVTIWCKRFNVNFATAPLTAASPTTARAGQ